MSASMTAISGERKGLLATLGAPTLSAMYPNDFELYMCSLEVVDSRGRVCEFFAFPVTPNSIKLGPMESVDNIKLSMNGITVIKTPKMLPVDIDIQGTFGRRFKFLFSQSLVDASAISFSTYGGVFDRKEGYREGGLSIKNALYNSQIKTGYGCTKILEAICDKSKGVDEDGNFFKVFFYNPMFNRHYMVEGLQIQLNQNKTDSNMLWNYNVSMKGVAYAHDTRSNEADDALKKTMQASIANKVIDRTLSKLRSFTHEFIYSRPTVRSENISKPNRPY